MTANSTVTMRLAEFAAHTHLSELPEDVVTRASELVGASLVAGVRGADTAEARTLHEFLTAFDGTFPPPGGAVLGSLGRLPLSAAVTFNAACIVLGGAAAPGPEVVSGVLAAAEMEAEKDTAPRRSLLAGVAVGAETGFRIAQAIARRRPDSGWCMRALTGRIATAVAVVNILGGGVDELRQAIGLGATQAAGLAYLPPSTGAALLTGRVARDGVEAALLSFTGWKGPVRPIEGGRGLFRLLTGSDDTADAQEIVTGLGEDWLFASPVTETSAIEQAHRLFSDENPVNDDPFLRFLQRIKSESVRSHSDGADSRPIGADLGSHISHQPGRTVS
jgi:2-methylcitrate dehydratase PrpD